MRITIFLLLILEPQPDETNREESDEDTNQGCPITQKQTAQQTGEIANNICR